jgi:Protein of unknown function (DUF2442)
LGEKNPNSGMIDPNMGMKTGPPASSTPADAPSPNLRQRMPKLLSIQQTAPWEMKLEFSDGTLARFDGKDYLNSRNGPLLDALRDANFFARAFIDAGALCWPNGLALSPKRLRELVSAAVVAE